MAEHDSHSDTGSGLNSETEIVLPDSFADVDSMCVGLAPVWCPDARILILGSMPGQRSLELQAYYAHPRNAFWQIAEALFGVPAEAPYAQRLGRMVDAGVALWDVIGRCRRRGSLDQHIEPDSVEANDLSGLLQRSVQLERIIFNGAAAEAAFRRHVVPGLAPQLAAIERVRVPSTSPAHAAMSRAAKIEAWRGALP